MKIKYVIVTYNQPKDLKNIYESIINEDNDVEKDDIIIINNHSNFVFDGEARVLHNQTRPDESLGGLAQNWNQGILAAFSKCNNPSADWVALCQCDITFRSGWKKDFRDTVNEKKLDFVSSAPGDQVTLCNLRAFKTLGWWDERFSGIGYHEFDYFLRAYLRLGPAAAIQGHGSELVWNWPEELRIINRQSVDGSGHSSRINGQLLGHLWRKWGNDILEIIIAKADNEYCKNWPVEIDEIYGNWKQRESRLWKKDPPKDINWHPFFYADCKEDFSHIYESYVSLT